MKTFYETDDSDGQIVSYAGLLKYRPSNIKIFYYIL